MINTFWCKSENSLENGGKNPVRVVSANNKYTLAVCQVWKGDKN